MRSCSAPQCHHRDQHGFAICRRSPRPSAPCGARSRRLRSLLGNAQCSRAVGKLYISPSNPLGSIVHRERPAIWHAKYPLLHVRSRVRCAACQRHESSQANKGAVQARDRHQPDFGRSDGFLQLGRLLPVRFGAGVAGSSASRTAKRYTAGLGSSADRRFRRARQDGSCYPTSQAISHGTALRTCSRFRVRA